MKKICQILIFPVVLILAIVSFVHGAIPDLRNDGNAELKRVETQSGYQAFFANAGFYEGSNRTKVFGRKRPTTLWSDKRRTDCYEKSIRIMAQMPTAKEVQNARQTQALLKVLVRDAKTAKYLSRAVDALHTNYVEGSTIKGTISNHISKILRKINPKTIGGVRVSSTNLSKLGKAFKIIGYGFKAYDFAIGAAVQEALSGDLALGRLELLETILTARKQAGVGVDPVVFDAIGLTRANLIRSENYWGALITELSDRKSEIAKIGVIEGVRMAQKNSVALLKKYYIKHLNMGSKAAGTKAASVAGLWAFSLIATYETIDALLEQHYKAQVSVTASTLAYLIGDEMDKKRAPETPVLKGMKYQAEYTYYNQMVKVCSGALTAFKDFLSKGHLYKDARTYFKDLRTDIGDVIESQDFLTISAPGAFKDANQVIIAVVDSSGSMKDTDPKNLRIAALKMMIDSLGNRTALGIVDFDSSVKTLSEPLPLGDLASSQRKALHTALKKIDSNGGTDIRGGLKAAVGVIPTGSRKVALVLLTDGKDQSKNRWSGESDFIPKGVSVHTIGLSEKADRKSLSKLSAATMGIPEIAKTAADLQRIIADLFSSAEGDETVLMEEGLIKAGEVRQCTAFIEEGQGLASFRVSWPGSDIDLSLVDPRGQRITIKDAVKGGFGVEGETYDIIQVKHPTPGKWQVEVKGVAVSSKGEPYTLLVSGKEARIQAEWVLSAPVPEVGAPFEVSVKSQQEILWERAEVALWNPQGEKNQETVSLGGVVVVTGEDSAQTVFSAYIDEPGIYRIKILLSGTTAEGNQLSRYLDRTFRVADTGEGVKWADKKTDS